MKMKKKILSAAVTAVLGAGSAQAVTLTKDGQGGLLLFPYYTVQGNNETLVTITNVTDKGKAVKVRFHEAFNSREVLGFNLYLAPFDVWVGKVQNAPDRGAQLYTPDNSCSTLGTNLKNMHNYEYSGSRSDGGPEGPARQREGYISVIEMGEVDWQATVLLGDDGHWYADNDYSAHEDAPLKVERLPPPDVDTVKVKVWDRNDDGIIDIMHKDGVPNYCEGIALNFSGIWKDIDTNYGFRPPNGGLTGTLAVINVQDGSELSVRSAGINKAFLAPVHNFPDSTPPDFREIGDPANDKSRNLSVFWNREDGDWFLWPSRKVGMLDKVDGLSAALMASTVINDYTVNPATEAETAWVLTFPTKHHYVDPKYATDIKIAVDDEADDGWHVDGRGDPKPYPPFTTIFNGKACEPVWFRTISRDGESDSGVLRSPDDEGASLCYGVNVIQFGSTSNVFDAKNTVTRISDDALSGHSGWMAMYFADNGHEMRGTSETYGGERIFHGLPVIGFKVTVLRNSNVGIGASYAVATSHLYGPALYTKKPAGTIVPALPAMESEAKAGSPR